MTLLDPSSLADLAALSGAPVPCAGNQPVNLDDPSCFWFIEEGAVDLFLIEMEAGEIRSAPQHMLRAAAGRLLPGVKPDEKDTTLSLVAKGAPGTVLRRLPIANLEAARAAELARQVDAWLRDITVMLMRFVTDRPKPDALVEAGQAPRPVQGTLSARHGVVWTSEVRSGTGLFVGLVDPGTAGVGAGGEAIPLTPMSWLSLPNPVRLSARSSQSLAEEGQLLPALSSFHVTALALERLNRQLSVADQINLEFARSASRHADAESARRRLFDLYGSLQDGSTAANASVLPDVLRIIGRREGIDFRFPQRTVPGHTPVGLSDILDVSGIRARRVKLDRQDKWWLGDSNAMLAFRKKDDQPVALLPGLLGRYREIDPAGRRSHRVTARRAAALSEDAWVFYRSLPPHRLGLADLFRFAGRGSQLDLARLMLSGLLGSLILLVPALVLGIVVGKAVPDRDAGLLYAACAALVAMASVGALLHILRSMALLRLEARVGSRAEAAFWDRLLRLPPSVLRRYPVGDLATRGMTFQHLRDAALSVVADGVLSVVFLLPVFVVIFFHDRGLGGVTLAFSLVSLIVTVALGLRQIAPSARKINAARRIAGHLFQMINGIHKLRVGSAEGSAFAVWARDYREQKKAEMAEDAVESHLQAFGSALPLLAGTVLLLAVVLPGRPTISVADFLVIFTVFMAFQTAVSRLGEAFATIATVLPAFEQIRPLLAEAPEMATQGEPVENLGGEVLFDQVSFRFDPDGPLILDEVTIHARPGEFIAIVGESGAGKSTLFRLALGLERPCGGAVYYDGRDLQHLDRKQLCRRIGVVPQTVQLHPQDIWDNIATHHERVRAEEVWQAVETAVIAREIRAMPMSMLTSIGVSTGILSGGESQRIAIARALLRSPRIILLDEATNWLDNESQAELMDNLAALTATRIVIAHRLSTLRQADRVYVMRAGRVVQSGTFKELAKADGDFRELISRQVI